MLKLKINPVVAEDLKSIRDYIAEDNEKHAAKTIKEIYGKFENLQMFPDIGSIQELPLMDFKSEGFW